MAKQKKDTSHMLKDAGGFTVNEFLEALLRCRNEQSRRYAREVALGTQARVNLYADEKAAHEMKRAA